MTSIYSDLRKDLATHPLKRDILLLNDENSVKESIFNIVFTSPYERYRNPQFGAGIPADLFENISPTTEYEVKKRIEEAIANHESRAIGVDVVVVANNDYNNYQVTVTFHTINNFTPIVVSNILRRIR